MECKTGKLVKEYEAKHGRKVKIPKQLPFVVTKSFGRIVRDQLSLEYLNEKTKQKFKVYVTLEKAKIIKRNSDQIFTLSDGTEAIYRERGVACTLQFKKDEWDYIIGSNKYTGQEVRKKTLIEIAESLQ